MKAGRFLDQERKEVLKAGIQNLIRMQEQRVREIRSRPETDIPKTSSDATDPDKSKVRLEFTIKKHGLVNLNISGLSGRKALISRKRIAHFLIDIE